MTIHNHTDGVIIPSYKDMETNLNHNVKYGVVTAESRFGVVKYSTKLSKQQIDLILTIHASLELKISLDFHNREKDKIKNCKNEGEYNKEYYKFVSKNINDYVNEFNSRLKDYNVEITYFNIKRE